MTRDPLESVSYLGALVALLPAAVAFDLACAVVVLAVTSRKYGLRRWWDRGDTE